VWLLHKTLIAGFLIPHCNVNLEWHVQALEVLRIHHTWTWTWRPNDRWLTKSPPDFIVLLDFPLVRFICSGMQERQVFDRQENSQIDIIVRDCCQIFIWRIDISWIVNRNYLTVMFDIFTGLNIKIAIFLAVIPFSVVGGYQCYVYTQYENNALKMKAGASTSL
jgi:hypothetical protein